MRRLILSFCLLAVSTTVAAAQQYDLVLEGGRVLDPETGLDAGAQCGHPRRKNCSRLVRGTERRAGGLSWLH